ncbi:MAG: hypothetical protein A2504_10590 [Bdellovibrionales bacterium RIFOXYD12_FULL_39_22]|nr:MAG: hypothetical protein A2385_14225 [Bdellovibrionales bacterium RIFOXYB1_FULL_39_21]OFZ40391.1 MAG: hypothetical protein A2485_02915 [Bdellovibrionales bacterium RIFOXYC12_FULL_39_17]OFZ49640.1 MAG: hypothetical protein A2404_09375 [Bdellovibrionales bacterium RIFOXYC1_FULL_39_130]OFZ77310.1 MAG: hypothetical protein A2560_06040 [Bdellovibrionales bacterium RIFOXYD1_FULL_39_84]OFZ95965.1 MAG: hypothetical protein A2504_10590 [Bdellovibrionales bacterium RIFOXYD12_FULL_39_22]HLE11226.1 TI
MQTESPKQIFHYNDPVEYISAVYELKKSRNPQFSIRAWAKQLGYNNPSLLAQTLKGDRKIGLKLVKKIAENLKLMGDERKHLELLTLFKRATKDSEKEIYLELLNDLHPQNRISSLELDHFRYIADWYHLAILEMVGLRKFSPDPEKIASLLGKEVTALMAQKAIERLIRLGLLEKTKDRKLKRTNDNSLVINHKVSSEAIRKHHQQMITKALDSIESQSIGERDISSTTLSIQKNDLEKIKELINKFHKSVRKFAQTKDADETYQLNVQLFKLTL